MKFVIKLTAFLIYLLFIEENFILCNIISKNKQKNLKKYTDILDNKIYSLFLNANYYNNTNFLGNTNLLVSQPSYNGNIELLTPFNLRIGGLTTFIENSNDSLNQTTYDYSFKISYDLKLLKSKFIITPSYSRYFYSKNYSTIKKLFINNFSIDLDLKLNQFAIGISGTYLTGKSETFQLSVYNMFIVEKENLFFRNTIFTYSPTILLLFGKLDYLNYYYFKTFPYLMLNYLEKKDLYEIYWLKRHNPYITKEEIIDYFASKKSEDNFHLTSIFLIFPINYLISNFGININCSILLPYGYPDYFDKRIQYLFEVGISYLVDF